MRKLGWVLLVVVILVAAAAAILPGWIERQQNHVDGRPLIPVSEQARTLHATLTIVDLHADTLLWKRNLLTRANRGHIDLPRLREGNVALQLFSSVTKSPHGLNYDRNSADEADDITRLSIAQAQPVRTWDSLLQRSLWQAAKLDRAVAASNGELKQVGTPADLDALIAARSRARDKPIGAMLTIEGLHDLEGKADNLDRLYAAGYRMASLTHFFD